MGTKQLKEFLELLARLKPEEFLGVCKILCVKLFVEEDGQLVDADDGKAAKLEGENGILKFTARDPSDCNTDASNSTAAGQPNPRPTDTPRAKQFDVLLEEVLDKFCEMGRKPRRQLIKVLREATSGRSLARKEEQT